MAFVSSEQCSKRSHSQVPRNRAWIIERLKAPTKFPNEITPQWDVERCISQFSSCWDRISEISNFKEQRFILGHSLWGPVRGWLALRHHDGRAWRCKAVTHSSWEVAGRERYGEEAASNQIQSPRSWSHDPPNTPRSVF